MLDLPVMLKHIMWQVLGFSIHLRHPLAYLPHPISFPVGLGLLGRARGGWVFSKVKAYWA